jgi:hypothetical protein
MIRDFKHSPKRKQNEFHYMVHRWGYRRLDGQFAHAGNASGPPDQYPGGYRWAFAAGLVLPPLLGMGPINQNNISLPALLMSAAGAIMLLGIFNFFRRWSAFRLR